MVLVERVSYPRVAPLAPKVHVKLPGHRHEARASAPAERIRLGQTLGAGAMGSVCVGWHPARGTVAIKRAHNRVGEHVDCLHNEWASLRHVRHLHVVQHFGLEQHADETWLVMEYVEGDTLQRWLLTQATADTRRECPGHVAAELAAFPTEPSALVRHGEHALRETFRQIASGIAFLHASGCVHRDLKPENIMRSRTRVVIVDFGLASRTHATARVEPSHGTLEYLAPECLRGEAPSAASDWFALGVMLHQALHGGLPRDHALRARHVHSSAWSEGAERVPADLQALCMALLAGGAPGRAGRREAERVLGPLTPGRPLLGVR